MGSLIESSSHWLSLEYAQNLLSFGYQKKRAARGNDGRPLVEDLSREEINSRMHPYYPKTRMDWELVDLFLHISPGSSSFGSSYECQYEGVKQNGMRYGYGMVVYGGGRVSCSGRFLNNELYGMAHICFNGCLYRGQVKNGRPFGEGLLRDLEGKVYAVFLKSWDFFSVRNSRQLTAQEVDFANRNLRESLSLPQLFSLSLPLPDTYQLEIVGVEKVYRYINLETGETTIYQGGMHYCSVMEREVPHVYGKLIFSDGSKYEGQMSWSCCHGKGEFAFDNGWVYKGMFANNFIHGEGQLWCNERLIYEGSFKFGAFDGRGEKYFPDSSFYAGDFIEGKMDGQGTLYVGGRPSYQGRFVEDQIAPEEAEV